MSFLYCEPAVCVIGNEYEILIRAKQAGIFAVRVGEEIYYEENSGVLSSEKCFAKIRVPQSELNAAENYEVFWQKTERKAYSSVLSEPLCERFRFFAPTGGKFNLYHVADVHGRFYLAERCCEYFGDKTSLFIVNGDIGEVESAQDYLDSLTFLAKIGKGSVPILFTRGNHDARGKLAERFTDYFPANGKNTYYDFTFANLYGIVFDCGEDKIDANTDYGGDGNCVLGVNRFEAFRRRETQYLRSLSKQNKFTIAVGHIPPVQPSFQKGGVFDIEREEYRKWNEEFERLGIRLMLCGHMHKAYILQKDDEMNISSHNYPVVVGSACKFDCEHETLTGAAITIDGDKIEVWFNDSDGNRQRIM
ncbi:MAG: metallophosphoesterase [Lachnospiraceae bacterium]|nr:metallophosphoesterase [Lachnospiraceae bacterium]